VLVGILRGSTKKETEDELARFGCLTEKFAESLSA